MLTPARPGAEYPAVFAVRVLSRRERVREAEPRGRGHLRHRVQGQRLQEWPDCGPEEGAHGDGETHRLVLNSVYNDCVYNDIPVIVIEFHGPGHDASI